jgi:phosphatidylglycerol:prolipoprotein diacylglycerol transferase
MIPFLEWIDIAAPSLALGQAIGRWGNFFNQEIYGAPTSLPWKISIDPAHRLAGFENQSYYHPLFAYESILNLANMLLLIWISRRYRGSLKRGDVFNVYLIFYPVVRFGLDFLRLDASQVLNLNINQMIMAVVGVSAIGVLIWRHRPTRAAAAGEAEKQASASPTPKATAAVKRAGRRGTGALKRTSVKKGQARASTRKKPIRRR